MMNVLIRGMVWVLCVVMSQTAMAHSQCPALALEVQRMPLRALLTSLAEATHTNLIVDESVQGEADVHFNNVRCDTALAWIIQAHGLVQEQLGQVVVIRKRESPAQIGTTQIAVIPVRYAEASALAKTLEQDPALGLKPPQGWVQHDARMNQLLVRGRPEALDDVRRLITQLDQPVSQVQIEARIVVVRERFARQLGVNWQLGAVEGASRKSHRGLSLDLGTPLQEHAGMGLGFVAHRTLLNLELNALESEGHGHTLSQPRIVTAERRAATIRQGQEVPYQESTSSGGTSTRFRDAVLSLGVTPTIGDDRRITLALDIQNDSISDIRFNDMPAIDTNRIQTQVAVSNGETIALGGILTQKQVDRLHRTPWLGELPWVGALFRTAENAHEKVELLVFITPHIVEEARVG